MIPTYNECKELISIIDGFYERIIKIDDFTISIFGYDIITHKAYDIRLNDTQINAIELRGLCFVFDKSKLYSRFVMLNKFWEVDAHVDTRYDLIKNKQIKNITEKFDGSLIRFIKLPNDNIIAKTIGGFTNEQCTVANNIFNTNDAYNIIITNTLNDNIALFFEYISKDNLIVINYDKPELVLIKARDNNTGEYLDLDIIKSKYIGELDIKITNFLNITTLSELITLKNNSSDIEGWVRNINQNI